jgi:glycosyltransferase involved in cell wall biosynthesis
LISGMYPPAMCGVGDYTVQLSKALADCDGVKVGLLTHHEISPIDARVDQVVFTGNWGLGSTVKIWNGVKRWKPDVVHMQHPSLGLYRRSFSLLILIWLLRLHAIRLIVTLHEPIKMHSLPWLISFCMNAEALIYVRSNYLSLLGSIQHWLFSRCRSYLIANSSPIPTSRLTALQLQTLRLAQLQDKSRLLVFFGFVFPVKGIEYLFPIMNADRDRLLIIGACPDHDYRNQLIYEAKRQSLGGLISFTGVLPADQVADLMACADAVVLPFLSGAGMWNTSVHAALAQGTLVITTTTGEVRHDLERNIFFIQPKNSEAIRELLDMHAGRKVTPLSPHMEWKKIAEHHLQAYAFRGGEDV